MITQWDAYVVHEQTGLRAYTSEERARHMAERAFPADQKVELVSVTTMSGQTHQAWIMKPRKQL